MRSFLMTLLLLSMPALRAADRAPLVPLLWTQGQPPEVIRQSIQEIAASGNSGFVWESRVHPDYLGPRWWSDLGVVIAEAKRLALEVFIEDDYSFPSGGGGGAGGRVVAENPRFRHWTVSDRSMTIEGPAGPQRWEIPGGLGSEEQVVSVVAFPEPHRAGSEPIDLTARAQAEGGRSVTWQVPERKWRLCWCVTRPESGMMDVLNPEATASFIRLTHEATWQHFSSEFGKTFQGFFSDEAWMGNTGNTMAASYHSLPGTPDMPMPWSPAFLDYFQRRKGYDPRPLLPALWYDLGPRGRGARFDLMDSYASGFAENFFKPQQDWCHAHGVRLIGHLVEDDDADRGLGFGPGHWFRAMNFFDWPGFDVVLYQVTPGVDAGRQWVVNTEPDWTWDEEFEQFGLPAMARGAALNKNAAAIFSESFGAYGWSEGLRLVKWIGDWLIVNGVNAVTPHACTMLYHDPDSPPHFNRASGNPQWRYYGTWAEYFRRLQALSWESTPELDVAVLYTAESRWMGLAETEASAVRVLETHQISTAILPYDVWAAEGSFRDHRWLYHGQRFAAVVLPCVRYVPAKVMTRLAEFARGGGRVIVIDRWPEASVDGREDAQVSDAVAILHRSPSATLVAFQELPSVLEGLSPVVATPLTTTLVISRRQTPHGEWIFLHNRSLTATFRGRLRLRGARGQSARYDPEQDQYFIRPNSQTETGVEVETEIPPYTLEVLRVSQRLPKLQLSPRFRVAQEIRGPWQVSRATDDSGRRFETVGGHRTLEDWRHWPGLATYAGTLRYKCSVQLAQPAPGERLGLDAGAVGEIADLRLNGRAAGVRIAPPYVWDITALVRAGENTIELDVTNTAQAKWSDPFSRGDAMSGLLGPVKLLEGHARPR